MTTTRHSLTSIATALAMAAALIAATGPRVVAEESKDKDLTLTVTATCEDTEAVAAWGPVWYEIAGGDDDVVNDEASTVEVDTSDGGEWEITADIDPGWVTPLEACNDERVFPTGTYDVEVEVSVDVDGEPVVVDGLSWLDWEVDCDEDCDVPTTLEEINEHLVVLTLTVEQADATAVVKVTLTWTPSS